MIFVENNLKNKEKYKVRNSLFFDLLDADLFVK
jgi:hypothetical protein